MVDPDIVVWLNRAVGPTETELQRAATIIADRLCGAIANPIIRNAQEHRQLAKIQEWLETRGYRKITQQDAPTVIDMPAGTFGFRRDVPGMKEDGKQISIPVDVVVMPKHASLGEMPILIEAKSAGDFTNVNKRLEDFTQAHPPIDEAARFNLLICNPPYVRHHHIISSEKLRLQQLIRKLSGVNINGLAGLYCYFLCLSQAWLQPGGVSGWLVPSEFMDVNYGRAVKQFLLNNVTLLRIHRFDPNDVQFDDALVSSAVVWFRNDAPPSQQEIEFSYGGTLLRPKMSRLIGTDLLKKEPKWTQFPTWRAPQTPVTLRLADLFTIKRGIATGDNRFFILTPAEIRKHQLPTEYLRPILPSPRYILQDEIEADENGEPILDRRLFLLDCRVPEVVIKERYPTLWAYLQTGIGTVSEGYLCRHRKVWYYQEDRPPAPIVCTYLGRSDAASRRPFRFILNHSKATAPNVYLLLYVKPLLNTYLSKDPQLMRQIWQTLNTLPLESILGEGRVYGGGLHKLEPRELGNVDASLLLRELPDLTPSAKVTQLALFDFSND